MLKKLSYSAIAKYKDCQYAFMLEHIKGIKVPFVDSKYTLYGKLFHELIENIISNEIKFEDSKNYIDILITKYGINRDEYYDRIILEVTEFYLNHVNNFIYASEKITEQYFSIQFDGFKFNGFIDLIYVDKSGAHIIDWKTGKKLDSDLQLDLYAMAFYKMNNIVPTSVGFYYTKDKHTTKKSGITQADVENTEQWLIDFYKEVSTKTEFTHNTKNCFFCSFKDNCDKINKGNILII